MSSQQQHASPTPFEVRTARSRNATNSMQRSQQEEAAPAPVTLPKKLPQYNLWGNTEVYTIMQHITRVLKEPAGSLLEVVDIQVFLQFADLTFAEYVKKEPGDTKTVFVTALYCKSLKTCVEHFVTIFWRGCRPDTVWYSENLSNPLQDLAESLGSQLLQLSGRLGCPGRVKRCHGVASDKPNSCGWAVINDTAYLALGKDISLSPSFLAPLLPYDVVQEGGERLAAAVQRLTNAPPHDDDVCLPACRAEPLPSGSGKPSPPLKQHRDELDVASARNLELRRFDNSCLCDDLLRASAVITHGIRTIKQSLRELSANEAAGRAAQERMEQELEELRRTIEGFPDLGRPLPSGSGKPSPPRKRRRDEPDAAVQFDLRFLANDRLWGKLVSVSDAMTDAIRTIKQTLREMAANEAECCAEDERVGKRWREIDQFLQKCAQLARFIA